MNVRTCGADACGAAAGGVGVSGSVFDFGSELRCGSDKELGDGCAVTMLAGIDVCFLELVSFPVSLSTSYVVVTVYLNSKKLFIQILFKIKITSELVKRMKYVNRRVVLRTKSTELS